MTDLAVWGGFLVYFAIGLPIARREYTRQYKYIRKYGSYDSAPPGMMATLALFFWPVFYLRHYFQGELRKEITAQQKLQDEIAFWRRVAENEYSTPAEKSIARDFMMRVKG